MDTASSSPPYTRSRAASTRLVEAGGDCSVDSIVEAVIARLHASGIAAVTAVTSESTAAESAADRAAAAASRPATTPAAAAAADAAADAAPAAADGPHQGRDRNLLFGGGTGDRNVPSIFDYAVPGRIPAAGRGRLRICGGGGRPFQ